MADFQSIRFEPKRPLLREISADRLNSILAEIKRNKPLPGRGITLRQTGQGTAIDLATAIKSGGSAAETHPFQISVALNPLTNNYQATVRPGTLNQLLPTNIFQGAALQKFTYPQNTLRHVILSAEADGGQFTSCEIQVSESAPSAQAPALYSLPTSMQLLLGVVYNATVFQVAKNNFSLAGKELFRIAKAAPAPGEVAFNVYYAWA